MQAIHYHSIKITAVLSKNYNTDKRSTKLNTTLYVCMTSHYFLVLFCDLFYHILQKSQNFRPLNAVNYWHVYNKRLDYTNKLHLALLTTLCISNHSNLTRLSHQSLSLKSLRVPPLNDDYTMNNLSPLYPSISLVREQLYRQATSRPVAAPPSVVPAPTPAAPADCNAATMPPPQPVVAAADIILAPQLPVQIRNNKI